MKSARPRGTVTLLGGSGEIADTLEILQLVWALHVPAKIVVIPIAYEHPASLGERYVELFHECGAEQVDVFDIRNRAEVSRRGLQETVRRADMVFFTGGNQLRLNELLLNTPLHRTIGERFEAGMPLAGTSAGAEMMGNPVIFDGDNAFMQKGKVLHTEGFGFLPGLVIDSHFVRRHRLGRLLQALAENWCESAVGIDEDTGLVCHADGSCEVIGKGMVVKVCRTQKFSANYSTISQGGLYSFCDAGLSCYAPGTRLEL